MTYGRQALRALVARIGERAPLGGPYASATEAYRDLILGAVPIIHSDGTLLAWDGRPSGTDVFSPVGDTQQADGRYLGLRGEPGAPWRDIEGPSGGVVGSIYCHDEALPGPIGSIFPTPMLPLNDDGDRDAGLEQRVSGFGLGTQANWSNQARVLVDIWDSEDEWSCAALISTTNASSHTRTTHEHHEYDAINDLGVPKQGPQLAANVRNVRFIMFDVDNTIVGNRNVGGAGGGGGAALPSNTPHIVIAGYNRTSADEADMVIRAYEADGTPIRSNSNSGNTGFTQSKMPGASQFVSNCAWLAVWRGRNLAADATDSDAYALAAAAGNRLILNPDHLITGLRTGIFDPNDSTRLIVRATSGAGARKQARRPVKL
jgi:hypothetical protein